MLSLFTKIKIQTEMAALYLVLVLFVLAILAPWIIPNKKLSDNKHDINESTEE